MDYRERNEKVLKGLGIYKMFVMDFKHTVHLRDIAQDEIKQWFEDIISSDNLLNVINMGLVWDSTISGVLWRDVYNAFSIHRRLTDADVLIAAFKKAYNRNGRIWTYEKET
jgi:hypothetical protein